MIITTDEMSRRQLFERPFTFLTFFSGKRASWMKTTSVRKIDRSSSWPRNRTQSVRCIVIHPGCESKSPFVFHSHSLRFCNLHFTPLTKNQHDISALIRNITGTKYASYPLMSRRLHRHSSAAIYIRLLKTGCI